ncbi:MAG: hypothetical protein AAGH78_02315 [Cyanobacteria bacterium P01_H01_bin.58]
MANGATSGQGVAASVQGASALRSTLTDFAASGQEEAGALAGVAQQVLEDPVALQQLSDRVFELLAQDIRLQRERGHTYGSR